MVVVAVGVGVGVAVAVGVGVGVAVAVVVVVVVGVAVGVGVGVVVVVGVAVGVAVVVVLAMTLNERIAKRKAEGWTLSHWHVRRASGLYSGTDTNPDGSMRQHTLKHRYQTYEDAISDVGKLSRGAVAIPVFTRTIRTKRGHSFSWALARMKEGRWVRISLWPKAAKIRLHNEWITTENPQKDFQPQVCHIMSMEWELAE